MSVESAALATALDGLGWGEPLDLVAWSYGALITLDFALSHQERVRTLTLIEPPTIWVLPDRGMNDPDIRTESSFKLGDDVSEADFKQFLHMSGLVPPGTDPTELPQWPVWLEHRRSLRGVPRAPFDHRDDPARLQAFDRPVLLVTGTGTVPYQRRIQDVLATLLSRAEHIEMPSGHGPHIVSMDRFLTELVQFHKRAGNARQATSKDGTVISYSEHRGTGQPLLFVHGTAGDHRGWSAISPHFEQEVTVYAMDRRGRGASGDAPAYDFMREAEDVVAVIEAIGEPVFLFGHSFGGLVSLEAALLTDKVSRLILYEPPIPTGVSTIPQGVPERIQTLVDRGELEAAMEVFIREVAQIPEHELEAYRQSPLWKARIPLVTTIPRELAIEETYVFNSGRFTGLQVPIMLLLGGDSPQMYRKAVEIVNSALPNSEIVILPGQQHLAHHTHPALLAREVLQFLAE